MVLWQQVQALVDSVEKIGVERFFEVLKLLRHLRADQPFFYRQTPQLGDQLTPADRLAAGVAALTAFHAQPDRWREQQAVDLSEIVHADDGLGIKHRPFMQDRATVAAFPQAKHKEEWN
jgi:hypothetical protein